jgi:hypothetical protein
LSASTNVSGVVAIAGSFRVMNMDWLASLPLRFSLSVNPVLALGQSLIQINVAPASNGFPVIVTVLVPGAVALH